MFNFNIKHLIINIKSYMLKPLRVHGTNECSQLASKSSWDSQDFGDVNMVLKMAHFNKSSRPQWVNASVFRHRRHYVLGLSVHLSVHPGISQKCMKGMACNLAFWCVLRVHSHQGNVREKLNLVWSGNFTKCQRNFDILQNVCKTLWNFT